jgi:prepilin-type N-terminal cleavage/methylation domain-containing protein
MVVPGNSEKGFTLIEVLASLTLVALIFISFMGLMSNSFLFTEKNDDKLQAVNLARLALSNYQVQKESTITNSEIVLTNEDYNHTDLHLKALVTQTTQEAQIGLYMVKITVEDSNGKVLAETYGYTEEKDDSED